MAPRGLNVHGLVRERVHVGQADGAQGQLAVGRVGGSGPAVQGVANHRIPACSQVNANLVGSPGARPAFQQRDAPADGDAAKCGFSRFPASLIHADAALRVGFGREFQAANPGGLLHFTFHNCQVHLLHLPPLEQSGIGRQRSGTPGQQQYSAGVPVQAVHKTQILESTRPSPPVAGPQGRLQGRLQVSSGALPVDRDEQPPGRFVHGQYGSVLVEDRNGVATGQFDPFGLAHDLAKPSPANHDQQGWVGAGIPTTWRPPGPVQVGGIHCVAGERRRVLDRLGVRPMMAPLLGGCSNRGGQT